MFNYNGSKFTSKVILLKPPADEVGKRPFRWPHILPIQMHDSYTTFLESTINCHGCHSCYSSLLISTLAKPSVTYRTVSRNGSKLTTKVDILRKTPPMRSRSDQFLGQESSTTTRKPSLPDTDKKCRTFVPQSQ